jgi:2-keto-4-pentenoate hydratase
MGMSDSNVVGMKIALTSPEAQRRVGCSRPIWGWLTHEMELPSGAQIAGPHFPSLRAEAELAFILGRDLRGPGVTYRDVLAATDAICPGIELPTRFPTGVKVSAGELMARNAMAGKFVLGHPVSGWRHLDLALLGVVLNVNSDIQPTPSLRLSTTLPVPRHFPRQCRTIFVPDRSYSPAGSHRQWH